ncbi:MAG: peptidoglycan DD-metalloendopeptidase family protein [Actinomycetota bacterium]|nr:peptidoglycan DD-metalloendopeptidase family protein [Actinomycetota bacterium]
MRSGAMIAVITVTLGALVTPPARADVAIRLTPPVDAPISHHFDAPESRFGAGHRGVDYAVPAGTAIRAAAAGTVTFAGSVAGVLAVTIDHSAGLVTTYSDLSSIVVTEGEVVTEGTWIGRSGRSHVDDGLHLGVKLNGRYVDPEIVLAPIDVAQAIHLAPLVWSPDDVPVLGPLLAPATDAGSAARPCSTLAPLGAQRSPPNPNIAVAVAGITSKTAGGIDARIYEDGPASLGYPADRIYRFSYAGIDGPRLHRPYARTDTYVDLRLAAERLRSLLAAIHRRHPTDDVDLIAHSQGGVVARLYLERFATAASALPHVDHLVTFSSPHRGSPAAAEIPELDDRTLTGARALDLFSRWSRTGVPIPDPRSVSARQLAPGSGLMEGLASEDVSFGTRVLTLAIPNDPVVPADRTSIPGHPARVVPWSGHPLAGHGAILESGAARALAYSFLRDAGVGCRTSWDHGGRLIGRAVGAAQSQIDRLYAGVEERAAAAALSVARIPPPVGRLIYRVAVATKKPARP